MIFDKANRLNEKTFVGLRNFYFDCSMCGLTSAATCSRFHAITGGKGPASGQCPLDSAPTARPRMFHKLDH